MWLACFALVFTLSCAVGELSAQTPFELIHGDVLRQLQAAKTGPRAQILAPTPTPNQLQFDVLHYELDIAINPDLHVVDGSVKTTLASLVDGLVDVDLDLSSLLTVSSVTAEAGAPLTWQRTGDLLSVDLASPLALGDSATITVAYNGPPAGSLYFATHLGVPVIFSLSEPWGARSWWPCKDYPDDKATFDLYWSVPAELVATSNGDALGFTDVVRWAAPYRRYHWREDYPMTTYLASIAASDYVRLDDAFVYAQGDTMPVTHYVYPDLAAAAAVDFDIAVPALEFLSSTFGLYPFVNEKYGVALCAIGGGMEHQTLTSYGAAFVLGDHSYDWLYIHELAHMWFGDLITCKNWVHVWLNEGFAAYTEALWAEHIGGFPELRARMEVKDQPFRWNNGPILRDPNVSSSSYYFDNVVYGKGAWVLHMLRHVVGDAAFFASLQAYVASPAFRYGVAESSDFQAVCESVHGGSLDWFFDPWLTRTDRLQYDWTWRTWEWLGNHQVSVVVEQRQTDLYTMPVDIRVTTTTQQVDTLLWVSNRSDALWLEFEDPIADVQLDPDHWILCDAVQYTSAAPDLPHATALLQNEPNPFNPGTNIRYELAESAPVRLRIYDARGILVRTLYDAPQSAGRHAVSWNGRDDSGQPLASGLYLYQLEAGERRTTRKMVLLR